MFNYISKWGERKLKQISFHIHLIAKLKSLGFSESAENWVHFYTLQGMREQSIKLESSLVICSKVEDAHIL